MKQSFLYLTSLLTVCRFANESPKQMCLKKAVKEVDTFYLPQQTAVESRKQNHYVRAVLKSNKLLLIQCNMVPISLSKHLVCYQYSL